MKIKFNIFLCFFLLITPSLLVFKALFTHSTLVGLDAPFLFSEGLLDLLIKPQTWNEWGGALGHVNNAIWLFPLNFIYGFVGGLFGGSNYLAIRVVFIVPAIVLAFLGPFMLTRYFNFSKLVGFFASLLYVFNTYFLLLLDGGQVGIALAYGFFPFALVQYCKLIAYPSVFNFLLALVVLNIHIHTDIRLAVIALLASLLLWIFKQGFYRKRLIVSSLFWIFVLLATSFFLNAYWIYPLFMLDLEGLSTSVTSLKLVSLLNALTLYQPHWPNNEFGKVLPPPFYFVFIPVLWVLGHFLSRDKKNMHIVLTLLVFIFLVKGSADPLGYYYEFVVNNFPFGSLFRDSTKFFAPVILLTGVLVGKTVDYLSQHKIKLISTAVIPVVYVFILFLIAPAFWGGLGGALAGKFLEADYQIIAQKIAGENGTFRSAWFPMKPAFSYFSTTNPSFDARYLADKKPVATFNVGTYDRFNFLHSGLADEWLELFNVKYLFLKQNDQDLKNFAQIQEWQSLVDRVNTNAEIKELYWGLNISAYELSNPKSRVFGKNQAILVVGSQDIYDKLLSKKPEYDIADYLFFFAEDGLVDVNALLSAQAQHLSILFNDKTEIDLQMSLLNWFDFLTPVSSQWSFRESADYLKWKYEFLVQMIDTKELDYDKGVNFSTVAGEKINYIFSNGDGDYVLAMRVLDKEGATPLNFRMNGEVLVNDKSTESNFEWRIYPVKVRGKTVLEIENSGGFHAVNVVKLIPKDVWDRANKKTGDLLGNFKVLNIDELVTDKSVVELVDFEMEVPTEVKIKNPKDGWIVFSSTYEGDWVAQNNGRIMSQSFPAYSAINAFYVSGHDRVQLRYGGQDFLEDGIKISLVTVIFLFTGLFALLLKKR